MLNFDERHGPAELQGVDFPDLSAAEWWRDAKLGFFVHWGLYSLPGFAKLPDGQSQPEHAYRDHTYAEWYGNTVRIAGSAAQTYQRDSYGEGTSYEDLADLWHPTEFNAAGLLDLLVRAGGRYVVPTTKHHDGFCLWDSSTTPFNSRRRGPQRDLIAEIVDATRRAGVRVGLYFSGALDWHCSDFPPIESDRDLFALRRNDESFARHVAAQIDELATRFSPDIIWNDIDWPDAGKGTEWFGLAQIFRRLQSSNPDIVVNDRWGVPVHGHLTREYSFVPEIQAEPWEATRGLGGSFGYNRLEGPEHLLGTPEAVRLLVDVVSKNGNLLLNVGPNAAGQVSDEQQQTLRGLGSWLDRHGESIFGTRPWKRFGDAENVRFTRKGGLLYIHVLHPATSHVAWPSDVDHSDAMWLSNNDPVTVNRGQLAIPDQLRSLPVATVKVTM